MVATDSKPPYNEVLKVCYLITLLKLSRPDGTGAHITAIKVIMEKFQRRSQQSSRYTVHAIVTSLFVSILFHFTLILLKLEHSLITADLLNENPTKKVMLLYIKNWFNQVLQMDIFPEC